MSLQPDRNFVKTNSWTNWPHRFCLYLTAYFVRQDGVMACVQFPSPSYKIHHIPTVRMSRKRKKKNWLWHEKERHKCFILVLKLTLTRCLDAIEHAIETKADEERRVKEACAVAWGCDHLQLQLGSMSQLESYITAAWEISFLAQIWVWNWATWWFKVLQAFPVFHL